MNSFKKKYQYVYDTVINDLESSIGFSLRSGSRILDYGCGTGIVSLRFAKEHSNVNVKGVDLHDAFKSIFREAISNGVDIKEINLDNLNYTQIGDDKNNESSYAIAKNSEVVLNQGIFINEYYDFVYSWCVFEHIDQFLIDDILNRIWKSLKKDGLFYLKINPLYYSNRGAHMHEIICEPWGHLKFQHSILKKMFFSTKGNKSQKSKELIWHQYITLNKLTADNLKSLICNAGFEIVYEKRLYEGTPSSELLSTYNKEVLTNKDVVFILKKTKE